MLSLIIGTKAFVLALLLLSMRFIEAMLQTYGIRPNKYMQHVLPTPKILAQYPRSHGSFSNKPSDSQVKA
jgi:hypothetical protein